MQHRLERGSAALEFALVLPILLILTLAVVQVGLIIRDDLVLVAAARAGAREAAVTADDSQVRAAVEGAAASLQTDRIELSVQRSRRGGPTSVSLVYHEPLVVPFVDWLFPSSVELNSSASMRQEFE